MTNGIIRPREWNEEVIRCSHPRNHARSALLFRVGRTAISIEDTANPNNEVINSVSKASNSSASASITITMTGLLDE
jgi:hypothetical protein